jgi:hypothetical protein
MVQSVDGIDGFICIPPVYCSMGELNGKCDFRDCESNKYRHFLGYHFCNEHNWYLRMYMKKYARDRDPYEFMEEFT